MNYLTEKRKMKRSISALLITAETIMVFLVPLGLIIWLVVNKLQDINLAPQTFIEPIRQPQPASTDRKSTRLNSSH